MNEDKKFYKCPEIDNRSPWCRSCSHNGEHVHVGITREAGKDASCPKCKPVEQEFICPKVKICGFFSLSCLRAEKHKHIDGKCKINIGCCPSCIPVSNEIEKEKLCGKENAECIWFKEGSTVCGTTSSCQYKKPTGVPDFIGEKHAVTQSVESTEIDKIRNQQIDEEKLRHNPTYKLTESEDEVIDDIKYCVEHGKNIQRKEIKQKLRKIHYDKAIEEIKPLHTPSNMNPGCNDLHSRIIEKLTKLKER